MANDEQMSDALALLTWLNEGPSDAPMPAEGRLHETVEFIIARLAAPAPRVEVDDAMVERALAAHKNRPPVGWVGLRHELDAFHMREALTAALNPAKDGE